MGNAKVIGRARALYEVW